MGLKTARSNVQQEFERILRQSNPYKLRLIRANPFTCPGVTGGGLCFANGRTSLVNTCPLCSGTGYNGVTFDVNGNRVYNGQPYDDTIAPASVSYYITADLQTGHGLYGSGGDFLALLADLGKYDVGDGTLFTMMYDRDHATGKLIFPRVDPSLVRPDRIVNEYFDEQQNIYNIVRGMIISNGAIKICRQFTVESGTFTSTGASGR